MRVWKLEASWTEDRLTSKWGEALASTREEALEICKSTSGCPFNFVHEKHPKMLWPGIPGKVVCW